MLLSKKLIAFIGGGNMTRNLAKGLLQKGHPPGSIIVSNRSSAKLAQLVSELGVRAAPSNLEAAEGADLIILSVKPHVVQEVCKEIAPIFREKKKNPLIISLASATRIEDIASWLGSESLGIVRTMTNIAISIARGTTALFAPSILSEEQRQSVEAIFNAVGHSFWVEQEQDLNSLTPLIGCGPAFLYLLIEALQKAAVDHGVSASLATEITANIIAAASELALQSEQSVTELRRTVSTPKGITVKAIDSLGEDRYHGLFHASYKAALERCEELEQTQSPVPK